MPNRLANEKSPYLLQHANNPVAWYPWGEEAFQKAEKENKPIFLSVGYSTCHWCYVMERESFEDEEVAQILNASYIAIKVDREERPDLDHIYLTFCQTLTGHGGWPLTVIMTSEKQPFFAGTYFPKENRDGFPGLMAILTKVAQLWQTEREMLLRSGEELTAAVRRGEQQSRAGSLTRAVPEEAYRQLEQRYDTVYGGFGQAPKFPMPHNLTFLLRYYVAKGEKKALEMVESTLRRMYQGGIFDHLGFGFSRYATDRQWLVPHFEKMLYDNALLAIAYLETYQITQKKFYAEVAEKIFTFVFQELTSPEGGFYSALDADTEGVEGKFYVWTPEEVSAVLGAEAGAEYCQAYDITEKGNFAGSNIPNLIHRKVPPDADANADADVNVNANENENENANANGTSLSMTGKMEAYRQKLFAAREKRVHPFRDDKILTSWNGLMIVALAKGARVLGQAAYGEAAERAAAFLAEKLTSKTGRLFARYRDGEAAYPAYLDDYAFMVWAYLELYETTYQAAYLAKAIALNREMLELFAGKETAAQKQDEKQDETLGEAPGKMSVETPIKMSDETVGEIGEIKGETAGKIKDGKPGEVPEKTGGEPLRLYLTGQDSEDLLFRPRDIFDGAVPAGNSVALLNMLRLAALTEDERLRERAWQLLAACGAEINAQPIGYTFLLQAYLSA